MISWQRERPCEEALRTREFEPDDPNYTPRISGIINVEDGRYDFAMSILKSDDGDPDYCIRNTFTYPGTARQARQDSSTPTWKMRTRCQALKENREKVTIAGDIDTFTDTVWESLNEDNKVSLFVRYIDIATGTYETRIVNKNK